jgi:hypothetical protein
MQCNFFLESYSTFLYVFADGGNCRVLEVDEATGVVSLEMEVRVSIAMQSHMSVN